MFVLSRGHAPVTFSEQVAKNKSYVLGYNSADLVFHELKIRGKFKRHSFVDLHEELNVPFLGIPGLVVSASGTFFFHLNAYLQVSDSSS